MPMITCCESTVSYFLDESMSITKGYGVDVLPNSAKCHTDKKSSDKDFSPQIFFLNLIVVKLLSTGNFYQYFFIFRFQLLIPTFVLF